MGQDRQLSLLGIVCLFATGCFSYAPYGHPATFAPPNTAMAPQPYGTIQVPPGAVWVPASPAGTNELAAPNPVHKSAPTTFEEDHETTSEKAVPAPADPGKTRPSEATEPFGLNGGTRLEGQGVTVGRRARPQPLIDDPPSSIANADAPELADFEGALDSDDEPRLPRANVSSAEFRTQVRSNAVTPVSASVAKFGYDAEAYSWLQGVIEYDSKHKVWHLTYSDSPDDTDQFGGEVTLKNPEHFKTLRSGQMVSVMGQFDPDQRDRLGKPVYEVTELNPAVKR